MEVTWLGQAGLLLDLDGLCVLIDPYLSDSVAKIQPQNHRRIPVDERFFAVKPNVIVITHSHADHLDKETLCHYLSKDSEITVLASGNAWQNVRETFGGIKNNYVQFNRGTEWTEGELFFKAVYAEHSDDEAIGIIVKAEGKTYYITGDTLYNEKIFGDITEKIDYVFLPVNGRGNNMNFIDGARFCQRLNAVAVPLHCGLFDDLDLNAFPYENKVVPEFYKEINL